MSPIIYEIEIKYDYFSGCTKNTRIPFARLPPNFTLLSRQITFMQTLNENPLHLQFNIVR